MGRPAAAGRQSCSKGPADANNPAESRPDLHAAGKPCRRQLFTYHWCFPQSQDSRLMGRIFEVRKHTMFARWNRMAKQFAKVGKDITIAVKAGGSDPHGNPALRR